MIAAYWLLPAAFLVAFSRPQSKAKQPRRQKKQQRGTNERCCRLRPRPAYLPCCLDESGSTKYSRTAEQRSNRRNISQSADVCFFAFLPLLLAGCLCCRSAVQERKKRERKKRCVVAKT